MEIMMEKIPPLFVGRSVAVVVIRRRARHDG
jgi:hypothetical protein